MERENVRMQRVHFIALITFKGDLLLFHFLGFLFIIYYLVSVDLVWNNFIFNDALNITTGRFFDFRFKFFTLRLPTLSFDLIPLNNIISQQIEWISHWFSFRKRNVNFDMNKLSAHISKRCHRNSNRIDQFIKGV